MRLNRRFAEAENGSSVWAKRCLCFILDFCSFRCAPLPHSSRCAATSGDIMAQDGVDTARCTEAIMQLKVSQLKFVCMHLGLRRSAARKADFQDRVLHFMQVWGNGW